MYSYLVLTLILRATISSAVFQNHYACSNKQSKYRIDSDTLYKTVINWQPYLKGQYRKYAIFIGLKCLTPGFVQTGINITSVGTIMVCRK